MDKYNNIPQKSTQYRVATEPCVLHIVYNTRREVGLSAQQILWGTLALITGCMIVLRHWKTKNTIPFNEWWAEMTKITNYEQLIFKLNNRQEVFWEIWGPYMNTILNG